MNPPTNAKRDYIAVTLKNMIESVPADESANTLNKLYESLYYQAPEILDKYWSKIFLGCKDEFNEEDVIWHGKICDIYHDRMTEYFWEFK